MDGTILSTNFKNFFKKYNNKCILIFSTTLCYVIYLYINYCNLAWASTHNTKLQKMYQRQKRFLLLSSLILFCVGYRGHIEFLFARSSVFHVFQINKLQLVEFIYHYFNMPYVLNDYLSTLSNIHDYEYQLRPAFSRISNTQFNNPHC